MSTRWTNDQLKAINEEGSNIIVSAGAGSGKTAVLTERVITKLKKGININELLILTFTKAAALEMKERIRDAIKIDPSLKKQEELLESAFITTFDSYSLFVVNRFHYLLNLPNNVGIGDENVINLAKLRILNEIFDDKYSLKEENFTKLITTFCVKDDNALKDQILKIYNKLEIKDNRQDYLINYLSNYFNPSKIEEDIKSYEIELFKMISDIKNDFYNHEFLFTPDYFIKLEDALKGVFSAQDYDTLFLNLNIFRLPNIAKTETGFAKDYKNKLSDEVKDILKYCTYSSKEEIKNSIKQMKIYVEAIIEILTIFDERLTKYKFDNLLFSFSDIALFAIKLVKGYPNVASELKNSFNEILLDEYQDTNDLQEIFINYIANNNVYMVGDVKQSIYRFRNANPSLFMHKYNNYALNQGGIKIDLKKNFRSRHEVINNINNIFSLIMDDEIGQANYQVDHIMEYGNKAYDNNPMNYNYNYQFLFYNYEEKEFRDEEIEAFIIANDIKHKIESGFLVFDKKTKDFRPIQYKDITILIDRSNHFSLYRKIFDYLNIPLKILQNEDFTNSILIKIIRNMLYLLLNYRHNHYKDCDFLHALISVLRSFVYELSDVELYNLVKERKYYQNPYYEAIKDLIKEIDRMSLEDIILALYSITNIEEKLIKIGDVKNNSIVLEYIVDVAKNLSSIGYNIEDFIEYFDQVKHNKLSFVANVTTSSDNVCQIMTIHKSKGLEFSICYFPGLGAKFNFSDLKDRFIYNDDFGIITHYFDEGIGPTIYKHMLSIKEKEAEISERIRLLYVALTRCKEQMIFVSRNFEEERTPLQDGKIGTFVRKKYKSFYDILNSIYPHLVNSHNKKIIDLDKLELSKDFNQINNFDYPSFLQPSNIKLIKKSIKVDTSLVSTKSYSKKILTLLSKQDITNIDFGLKIHQILESFDFRNSNLDDLNLSPYLKDKLTKFLSLSIFDKIEQANIYQEYEFIYEDKNEIRNGVIDLLIEYEDSILIIDYKLKNIDDKEYINQLKGYHDYIKEITNKKVKTYLYSFLDEKLQEISEFVKL